MIAGWLDGIEPGKGAPAAAADTIKCLSVCEPWAWAIIHGPKGIENRSWATAYRGPLLIHASKSKAYLADPDELVASSRTVDEVRELVAATSLAYLSLDGLQAATRRPAEALCRGCLTRSYPTAVPVEFAKLRFEAAPA